MKKTKIQWCFSTINPVMGCDGCELWPSAGSVSAGIRKGLQSIGAVPFSPAVLERTLRKGSMSEIYSNRKAVARKLVGRDEQRAGTVVDVIRRQAKCYAGLLGTFRGGKKGYAEQFERPGLFPGRMAKAAKWNLPTEDEIATKPWLRGCPRMIFVSDMGDALSQSISFDYLLQEIVANVSSEAGARHIWLWLTKRPARMAKFGDWLTKRGVAWPENLMAMTTVTARSKSSRVDELRKVPSRLKGLSLEPLFGPVDLDFKSLDWVIVGGGSDILAEPFHVEWSLAVRKRCEMAGAAFFLKQLGKNPIYQNQPLSLRDKHGGDWTEWPKEWRVRDVPQSFRDYGQSNARR